MDKRYQVFVSSTYADLKEERSEVIKTLMQMDCVPAGMELFPAMDEEQLEFIKKVIDDCDYYLLIIGGRYGTVTKEGISFTEKEYDYAVSKGLKVVALIHGKPEQIPSGKTDDSATARKKLDAFRERTKKGRLVQFWTKIDELPGKVAVSMMATIKNYPAIGWVRASHLDQTNELLTELNAVRKQNEHLRLEVEKLTERLAGAKEENTGDHILDLSSMKDTVTIKGRYAPEGTKQTIPWEHDFSWEEIFMLLGPHLLDRPQENNVMAILRDLLFRRAQLTGSPGSINGELLIPIKLRLMAHGLIDVQREPEYTTQTWFLTVKGRQLMLVLNASRPEKSDSPVPEAEAETGDPQA